jgi:hypothetical protein
MVGDKREKERKNRLPRFVPLLESPAWTAMSHGAKAHSISLKRRNFANNYNNTRIFLSQRSVKELSHHNQTQRFREHPHLWICCPDTTKPTASVTRKPTRRCPHARERDHEYDPSPRKRRAAPPSPHQSAQSRRHGVLQIRRARCLGTRPICGLIHV